MSKGYRNIARSCLSLRNPHARHDDGDTALSRVRMGEAVLSERQIATECHFGRPMNERAEILVEIVEIFPKRHFRVSIKQLQ